MPIEPSLMDTQRLLLGVQLPDDVPFDLEDILAEYGSGASASPEAPAEPESAPQAAPGPEPEPVPAPEPEAEAEAEPQAAPGPKPPRRKWFSRRSRPAPEPPLPTPPPPEPEEEPLRSPQPVAEESAEEPQEDDASGIAELTEAELLDLAFWDDFAMAADLRLEPEPAEPESPEPESAGAGSAPPAPPPPAPPPAPPPVSMEDVVANTVDAVKEEQEKRQERLRKKLEKAGLKARRRTIKRREPSSRHPLPEADNEPPAGETANRHKRRLRACRKNLRAAAVLLVLLWTPWVLEQAGISTPFFSDSADNAALCVLIAQAIICILCWPVYRAAVFGLREGAWTIYATALLSTAVTLLDEMTMLLLPERTEAAPLGGIAAALSVAALWGLTGWHRGMAESFRIAAMGTPPRVADCSPQGIAKGLGSGSGFYTRAVMEDTSSQWQRLLLPVLAAASLVFAALSSVGQERPQDFLWCWSVLLCASSSLVFPLAFCVPFGRLAAHLSSRGAAVAGMYGASSLSADRRLVVTDTDLFPPGSAVLAGVKLYGEERNHALAYAATLAVQGGGLLCRVFGDACRQSRVSYQSLEHFHIHEDGGLSGMIHGETVLVGTPTFMRHKAVRLPPSMTAKNAVCLAVDGELTAAFAIKYTAAEPVEYALRVLRRNGFQLTLATRDGSLTPKLLKARFGMDCGAQRPELSERLALSDPEREAEGPEGLLFRDGLLPFASLAAGSRRLCQTVRAGNLLAIFSSIAGALLGFYLTFTGSYGVLTPILLLTYLLLWVAPVLPLVWTVDKG